MAGLLCFIFIEVCIKLLILLLMTGLSEERGLCCVVCFNARNPALCKATTVCSLEPKDQLCGGRKYMNNRGQIRYELGCVPSQICQKPVNTYFSLFNSAEPQILDQIKCCDSDLCNQGRTWNTDVTTVISNQATTNETSLSPVFSSKASDITRTTYDSSLLLSKSTTVKSKNLEKFKSTSKTVFETTNRKLSDTTLKTTSVPLILIFSKTTAALFTKMISKTKTLPSNKMISKTTVVPSNKMISKTTVVPISSTGWLRVPVHNTKWIHIPG